MQRGKGASNLNFKFKCLLVDFALLFLALARHWLDPPLLDPCSTLARPSLDPRSTSTLARPLIDPCSTIVGPFPLLDPCSTPARPSLELDLGSTLDRPWLDLCQTFARPLPDPSPPTLARPLLDPTLARPCSTARPAMLSRVERLWHRRSRTMLPTKPKSMCSQGRSRPT